LKGDIQSFIESLGIELKKFYNIEKKEVDIEKNILSFQKAFRSELRKNPFYELAHKPSDNFLSKHKKSIEIVKKYAQNKASAGGGKREKIWFKEDDLVAETKIKAEEAYQILDFLKSQGFLRAETWKLDQVWTIAYQA
jgi:hypothetical protein